VPNQLSDSHHEGAVAWTYPLFWLIAVVVSVTMLRWFKTKGWF
jgi:hypothetical protein